MMQILKMSPTRLDQKSLFEYFFYLGSSRVTKVNTSQIYFSVFVIFSNIQPVKNIQQVVKSVKTNFITNYKFGLRSFMV